MDLKVEIEMFKLDLARTIPEYYQGLERKEIAPRVVRSRPKISKVIRNCFYEPQTEEYNIFTSANVILRASEKNGESVE